MFYLGIPVLQQVAADIADRPREVPFFGPGVIDDPPLARRLREVQLRLEEPSIPLLEQEALVLGVLAQLVRRHADAPTSLARTGPEPRAVGLIKRYLEERYADEVSLEQLSHLTQLSRYHLIHVFRETVGLPPYAYLRQVRVARTKALLASERPIAEAALETGFSDQSQLRRLFKRLWGVTLGNHRNGVQDGSA